LRGLGAGAGLAVLVARVTVEGTSRRELAEFVTDDVLADYRKKFATGSSAPRRIHPR